MRLNLSALILATTIMIIGCSSNNRYWMHNNRQYLDHKTVGELALTGSHLANAYNLQDSNSMCIGEGIESTNISQNKALMEQMKLNQIFDTKSFLAYLNTQDKNITEQLNSGVRFLELQVCKQDNIFYTSNVYLGPRLSDIVSQIKTFAEDNPDELIIIDFDNNLWAPYGNMNIADASTVSNYLTSELGNNLVPQNMRYNTLGEIKSANKNIIILSTNPRLINNLLIWDKNQVTVTAPVEYSTIKKLLAVEDALLLPENAYTISIVPFYSAPQIKKTSNTTSTDDNDIIVANYLIDALDKHAIIVVTDWKHQQKLTNITIEDNKVLPSNAN